MQAARVVDLLRPWTRPLTVVDNHTPWQAGWRPQHDTSYPPALPPGGHGPAGERLDVVHMDIEM
jgi:hypothetical protein